MEEVSYYSIVQCIKVLNGTDEEVIPQLVKLKFHNFLVTVCFVHCRFCCAVLNGDVQSQPLLAELQALFALLLYSRRQAISPSTLLTVARPPGFQPGFQQDSSEFLT